MSWPTSYQQHLPSTVAPGWNDPPSVGPGAASNRLSRHKRLVDPSINGASQQQFGASPGQPYQPPTNNIPSQQHAPQPAGVQQFNQQPTQNFAIQQQPMANQGFRLTPQLLAGDNLAVLSQCRVFRQIVEILFTTLLLLKLYDFYNYINFMRALSRKAFNNLISYYFAKVMGPTTLEGHQVNTAQTSQSSYRPVFDAFSVNNKQNKADIFSTRNSLTLSSKASTAWNEAEKFDPPSTTSSAPMLNQKSVSLPERMYHKQSATAPSTPTPTNPLERQPASLIYSAPNCIAEGALRSSLASIDSLNYRPPVKAAGDVSLSGSQCVAFLTKASMRLHPVKCEGVQLRLASLKEQVTNDAITEPCIKKLNFVVDAIDREQYDEAWIFFEQLQECFPSEMGTWTHGLRLLISELKRSPSRTGSAGSQRLRTNILPLLHL